MNDKIWVCRYCCWPSLRPWMLLEKKLLTIWCWEGPQNPFFGRYLTSEPKYHMFMLLIRPPTHSDYCSYWWVLSNELKFCFGYYRGNKIFLKWSQKWVGSSLSDHYWKIKKINKPSNNKYFVIIFIIHDIIFLLKCSQHISQFPFSNIVVYLFINLVYIAKVNGSFVSIIFPY